MLETNLPAARPSRQRNMSKIRKAITLVIEHMPGAPQNEQGLRLLARLLDPALSDVTLVHAMADILSDLPAHPDDAQQFSRSIREREREQNRICTRLRTQLVQNGYHLRNEQNGTMLDDCAHQILDFVADSGQDLLVLDSQRPGSPGPAVATGHSHFSMLLATHAICSVLLLRKPMTTCREKLQVVFAVDGSEATMKAAERLGKLLRPEHAELTLVTVQSPLTAESAALAPFINTEIMAQALDTNANIVFDNVEQHLQGLPVSRRQKLTGSPATEIGCYAELENPDLLVVGSHNKKGFLAWLTGSVSGQLLHWGNHNILVVR